MVSPQLLTVKCFLFQCNGKVYDITAANKLHQLQLDQKKKMKIYYGLKRV
jgi:hypothetical protein